MAPLRIQFRPAPLVILALWLGLASCGGEKAAPPRPASSGGKVILGLAGDPKTFHPLFCDDVYSQKLNDYIWLRLYNHNRATRTDEPSLAESWEFEEASLTWTFHLRGDAKWSDGVPVTADDFVFAAAAALDPAVPTTLKEYLQTDGQPFAFSAPDPRTLLVRLPRFDSFAFVNLLELKPMRRDLHETALRERRFVEILGTGTPPENLVTCGPFKLRSFKPANSVVLARDPNSFMRDDSGAPLPYLDEFILLIVENFDSMAVRFQDGAMDLNEEIQPNTLAVLEDGAEKGDYTVFNPGLALTNTHYWFNQRPGGTHEGPGGRRVEWTPSAPGDEPPAGIKAKNYRPYVEPHKLKWFTSRDFRIACSMASNRDAMVKTTLFGQGVPIYGFETEASGVWNNPDIPRFPYDPAKAAATLEAAGFMDRDGDGIREDADGNPVRFTLVTNKENSTRERIATLLKENFRAVGFDVTLQVLDFNDIVTKSHDTSDYEAILLGLASGVPPHPAQSANIWLSSSRMHTWHPSQKAPATAWEAEVDRLYQSLKTTMDAAEQKRIYDRMQHLWAENQCVIHLVTPRLFVAASNRIGNIEPTVLRPYLSHNVERLYVK